MYYPSLEELSSEIKQKGMSNVREEDFGAKAGVFLEYRMRKNLDIGLLFAGGYSKDVVGEQKVSSSTYIPLIGTFTYITNTKMRSNFDISSSIFLYFAYRTSLLKGENLKHRIGGGIGNISLEKWGGTSVQMTTYLNGIWQSSASTGGGGTVDKSTLGGFVFTDILARPYKTLNFHLKTGYLLGGSDFGNVKVSANGLFLVGGTSLSF